MENVAEKFVEDSYKCVSNIVELTFEKMILEHLDFVEVMQCIIESYRADKVKNKDAHTAVIREIVNSVNAKKRVVEEETNMKKARVADEEREELYDQEKNFKSMIDEAVKECGTDLAAIAKFKGFDSPKWRIIMQNCVMNKLRFIPMLAHRGDVYYNIEYIVMEDEPEENRWFEFGNEHRSSWCCYLGHMAVTFSVWDDVKYHHENGLVNIY